MSYSNPIVIFYSTQTLLYLQENSTSHILKRNDLSQALKGHFNIDQYLSVLIPGSYTSIQEYSRLKSELDKLCPNLKNAVICILDVDANCRHIEKPTSKSYHLTASLWFI